MRKTGRRVALVGVAGVVGAVALGGSALAAAPKAGMHAATMKTHGVMKPHAKMKTHAKMKSK